MTGVLLVGLGRQTVKDHLPSVLRRDDCEIVGAVEPDRSRHAEAMSAAGIADFPIFDSLGQALDDLSPDVAIVSVPHNQYPDALASLASAKVATLKEKPLATSATEAAEFVKMYRATNTYLQVCVQRRFSRLYDTVSELVNQIGDMYSLYAEYTLNLPRLNSETLGWRADRSVSGGGAALDLGYHTVDLVTNLFGLPDWIFARMNYGSLSGDYSIDDSMKAMMLYNGRINGSMLTTKIYGKKGERIRIFGEDGFVYIDDRTVRLLDRQLNDIEVHTFVKKDEEVDRQLAHFLECARRSRQTYPDPLMDSQILNMRVIDALYASHEACEVVIP